MANHRREWLPWRDLFRFGVTVLGLSPNEFWGLSLCELRLLLAPQSASLGIAPQRQDFDALMALFPDQ